MARSWLKCFSNSESDTVDLIETGEVDSVKAVVSSEAAEHDAEADMKKGSKVASYS